MYSAVMDHYIEKWIPYTPNPSVPLPGVVPIPSVPLPGPIPINPYQPLMVPCPTHPPVTHEEIEEFHRLLDPARREETKA